MMILTCLALRLRLFLKGIDNSSRADISFGHPSIHLRNERTASTSLISGKYFFAKSLLFISLKVECWMLKILDVWHVDTLFNINFLKTEIQLLYSKRISRSATFYIYRVSRCHRLTDWFSKKRYNHLLRRVGSEERLIALIGSVFSRRNSPKLTNLFVPLHSLLALNTNCRCCIRDKHLASVMQDA